ncbi:hypothetical protein H4R33_002779 [Dimargaris cristalligena]|uniref:DUF7707 domain-containing protein n=1 Tax=Dimargaris cristalligena TaxID=215637 RepID=A0A4P9ZP51_9FUNG|nr:hypothetical protein H4R33_002779 [Dimargaris cristalligena]RKP35093.1 hypothetical protein BJ085DRAFT_29143 [Dimargaris cristalligena]|eukprot:RKP35093.1 hypothetical protein BJ085DRAFT_29143 [Dimargaris cristalligena]
MKLHLLILSAVCALLLPTAALAQDASSSTHVAATKTSAAAPKASATTTVSDAVKKSWCNQNNQFCTNVCLNMTSSAKTATCDYKSLTYECLCKNNQQPDSNTYTFPVVYYSCIQSVQDCQQKTCKNGDTICQQNCQKDCSAINDPFAGNVTQEVPTTIDEDTSDSDSTVDVFDNAAFSTTVNVAFVAVLASLLMCIHQF